MWAQWIDHWRYFSSNRRPRAAQTATRSTTAFPSARGSSITVRDYFYFSDYSFRQISLFEDHYSTRRGRLCWTVRGLVWLTTSARTSLEWVTVIFYFLRMKYFFRNNNINNNYYFRWSLTALRSRTRLSHRTCPAISSAVSVKVFFPGHFFEISLDNNAIFCSLWIFWCNIKKLWKLFIITFMQSPSPTSLRAVAKCPPNSYGNYFGASVWTLVRCRIWCRVA